MKVSVKDLAATIELKNKGIELDVYNSDGEHRGDLVVTKTQLIWCHGRTPRANGTAINWEDFIEYIESR
jgi:hypothetical protein